MQERTKNQDTLTAQEFAKIQLPDNAVILDVRTTEEWDTGHIIGALHIDYFSESFEDKIAELEKDRPYYIYCRAGKRSASVLYYMQKQGFQQCAHIIDGIIGITLANIPLIK